MERSHESAWGTPSPESGDDSPSGSSKKEKKKSGEASKVEQEKRPASSEFARIFGQEALQTAAKDAKVEGVISLRGPGANKDKPDEAKEKAARPDEGRAAGEEPPAEAASGEERDASAIEQEREVAAEVVDEAQAQHEQEAARAGGAEQAAAENVGQLLDNMEAGLETAPPQETAEQILGRTTEETAAALTGEEQPADDIAPLDWPGYPSGAENGAGSATSNPEAAAAWQQEQSRRAYDDDPDQSTTAAPYVAGGAGQGGGAFRPPVGYAAGFNPNAMPPAGGPVPAAANRGLRARAEEVSDALASGFWTGLIGGGLIGHWLGHRHERAKAKRAMTKQERVHQQQVAKYEAQVAASEARIRTLSEQQADAVRQAMRTTETAPAAARMEAAPAPAGQPRTPERPVVAAPAEARPSGIKTNAPKRVEMMTDAEVHEASRDVKIGDKTLYELKENGTVTAADERTLLRLAEQGGIENPARKYRFDQEVQRVLMRHELDPQLAQQVLQHELDTPAGQGAQALPAAPYSPLFTPETDRQPSSLAAASPVSRRTPPAKATHPLVVANIVAVAILAGLLLILLLISVTR